MSLPLVSIRFQIANQPADMVPAKFVLRRRECSLGSLPHSMADLRKPRSVFVLAILLCSHSLTFRSSMAINRCIDPDLFGRWHTDRMCRNEWVIGIKHAISLEFANLLHFIAVSSICFIADSGSYKPIPSTWNSISMIFLAFKWAAITQKECPFLYKLELQ